MSGDDSDADEQIPRKRTRVDHPPATSSLAATTGNGGAFDLRAAVGSVHGPLTTPGRAFDDSENVSVRPLVPVPFPC